LHADLLCESKLPRSEDGSLETKSHSFVVKIWLEETVAEDGRTTWRGHITHVPSKERLYFEDLKSISQFILPYLKQTGTTQRPFIHARRWTKSLRSFLRKMKLISRAK
jgi:hypothetical protein